MTAETLETTLELSSARKHYREEVIPTDKLRIMDRATEELVQSGLRQTAARAGDQVEDFILMDAHGAPVRLHQLLATGPAVIAFYRGGWCPYCNIELRGLQRALPRIRELGASLVAISPQIPDNSLSTEEKNGLEFPVLSDVGNTVARRFGIVFTLPKDLLETYEGFDHGLRDMNGNDGATDLPMPATFVLDRDGTIQLAFVEEDYTQRLDPEIIIDTLEKLARSN